MDIEIQESRTREERGGRRKHNYVGERGREIANWGGRGIQKDGRRDS